MQQIAQTKKKKAEYLESHAGKLVIKFFINTTVTSCQILTFAGSPVSDWSGHVPVEALLAVVAVASCCVVATVETDSTASTAGQLVQLHVKTTAAGMQIAVAG